MKKLLLSMMSVVMVIAMVGGGAFAYFSDTETSTGNTFAAGTLDLAMGPDSSVAGGVIATASDMAPGVIVPSTGSYQVNFKNIGTLPGFLTVNFSYSENDAAETGEFAASESNGLEASADEYAAKLVVTEAYLAGTNVAPYWAQQINDAHIAGGVINGLPTIYGLSKVTLQAWDSYSGKVNQAIAPNSIVTENFKMKLDESADNKYQSDGINITITGTLSQTNAPVLPWETVPVSNP
jgi:spore coat-associated protein N